ncbi:MAG: histidine phosphatase family protein [Candidatus Ancillula sp.]|jgi:broad specificity phosphatase PhoE|nr:histidine phosphatase family protein [Candidatus Ancillula sp.]
MTTKIHLLRHGEVENPDNVIYERLPDFHLSERGRQMAEVIASFITSTDDLKRISAIYSSPLTRTLETAAPSSRLLGDLDVKTDDRLIESWSNFRGLNVQDELRAMARRREFKKLFTLMSNPTLPSWGEHYVDIAKRMSNAINDIKASHMGESVLIVSHQSPIWCVRRFFEGRTPKHNVKKRVCSLASITTLEFNDDANELTKVCYRTPAASV